jgi:hypothetical protein
MEHNCICSKEKEIEKINTAINGNGKLGLSDRMIIVENKLDNVQSSIDEIKSWLKWGLTVIFIPFLLSLFNIIAKILPKINSVIATLSVW